MRSAELIDFVWKYICVSLEIVSYILCKYQKMTLIYFLLCCVYFWFFSPRTEKKLFAVENISWHERSKKAFAKTNNVSLNYYNIQRTPIEGEKNSITKLLNTFVTFLNQCTRFLLRFFILVLFSYRIIALTRLEIIS